MVVFALILLIIALISDYSSHRVSANSVLMVTLSGPVVERTEAGVVGSLRNVDETPLNSLRRAVNMARTDPRIVGLAVKVIDPSMEIAQAQEIAGAIRSFAATGKWTAAYIETAGESDPGNLAYMVA